MREFQVIRVNVGVEIQWAVLAVSPDGTRDWLAFHSSQAEAQSEADSLAEAESGPPGGPRTPEVVEIWFTE
jgi:hypothetical protein